MNHFLCVNIVEVHKMYVIVFCNLFQKCIECRVVRLGIYIHVISQSHSVLILLPWIFTDYETALSYSYWMHVSFEYMVRWVNWSTKLSWDKHKSWPIWDITWHQLVFKPGVYILCYIGIIIPINTGDNFPPLPWF